MQGLLGSMYVDPRMASYGGAARAIAPFTGFTKYPTSLGQVIGAAGAGGYGGLLGANRQNLTSYGQGLKIRELNLAAGRNEEFKAYAERMAVAAMQNNKPDMALRWRMDPKGALAHLRKMETVDPRRGMSAAKKYALDMGFVPGTSGFEEAMRGYQAKGKISINMGGVGSVLDAVATDGFKNALKGSADAGQKLFQLSEMTTLLATGVPQGRLESATLGVRNFLGSFGYKDPNMGIQEALQSLGNELALGKHGPGMGPMTDADFKIYQGIMPGLKNSKAGNALILQRVIREQMGRQMLADIYREQLSGGDASKFNPTKAWREVAKRLDEEIGPLVPIVGSIKEAEANPNYINKVVLIDGDPYFIEK